MSVQKVLVADDELEVLEVMVKRISAEGYQVIGAADGQEAWDKIQAEEPDVIVLDLNMPGLHGFEVLKRVRESTMTKKWQPVIIVSAQNELKDMQKGYELNADHYIAKPCSVDDIIKAIKLMEGLIPQRIKED
ncbi:MAG: DNA-binding response OmpR family regulator [Candidatus Omnitrophota bacterium]|jgi:DNA-binding response OmpR family regulator